MNIPETLINEMEAKVLAHPDSKREGARYGSFRHFFSHHSRWTNSWFSEVVRGKRKRITQKLRELCEFLDIDIERHLN